MSKIFSNNRNSNKIIFEGDPIYEEIEIEDDELMSENNFYQRWNNHKRLLLTKDEQLKLTNEDTRSFNGNPIDKKVQIRKLHPKRHKKKTKK